jgi:hypothetical protein
LKIQFPEDHDRQHEIALGFKQKSEVHFSGVVGCIDGMLLWTEQPLESDCALSGCGQKKFYCGRKSKFGLNMMGTVDDKNKFIDIDISHPGATSDYLAFSFSPLKTKLERPGFLAPGLYLFGDCAYVNTQFMVTPYKSAKGTQDDYNFFHSQIRINVECAFGMLVHRWGILRRALPGVMGLRKITALTMCLCSLHNFCIDERVLAEQSLIGDCAYNTSRGMISLQQSDDLNVDVTTEVPTELLGGGHHYDDSSDAARRRETYASRRQKGRVVILQKDILHDHVVNENKKRPTPIRWRKQ